MSTLETRKIEPLSGTTVTLGAAGDAVTVPTGATLKTNTIKDAGGNTIWTSNGSGTLSSVNSALQGGMVFISSQTGSSSASVSFTTGIDSTYDEYVFIYTNFEPAGDGGHFQFQCSIDGGSTYGVTATTTLFLAYHDESATSAGPQYNTGNDQAQHTSFISLNVGTGTVSDESASGILHLFSPASTTYVKHFYARTQSYQDNNYSTDGFSAGYFNVTNAINAIQFKASNGDTDNVVIAMYGMA
jgi:hypothetical protein